MIQFIVCFNESLTMIKNASAKIHIDVCPPGGKPVTRTISIIRVDKIYFFDEKNNLSKQVAMRGENNTKCSANFICMIE